MGTQRAPWKPAHVVERERAEQTARHASAQPAQMPFDPVLRTALIDKGILTVQDLADAEAKIRAITAAVEGQ